MSIDWVCWFPFQSGLERGRVRRTAQASNTTRQLEHGPTTQREGLSMLTTRREKTNKNTYIYNTQQEKTTHADSCELYSLERHLHIWNIQQGKTTHVFSCGDLENWACAFCLLHTIYTHLILMLKRTPRSKPVTERKHWLINKQWRGKIKAENQEGSGRLMGWGSFRT